MNKLVGQVVLDTDRRGERRSVLGEDAVAVVKGQSDALTCVVEDISDSGARISIEDETRFVPSRIKLYIEDRQMVAKCQKVWRSGAEIGLRFTSLVHVG